MIWYRVLYATGREESLAGLDELKRVLARKAPRVIWYAEAIIYCCQVCGTRGPWEPGWIGWRRYSERWDARGEGTDVYCSEACAKAENPDLKWPQWMNVDYEPCPIEVQRAKNDARWRERERKRRRSDHRRVPMPEWRGKGYCKWCNEPMGKSGRRTMWHADCADAFLLATNLYRQQRFLRERDGPLCQWPGCDQPGHEVDHKIPLWSVDQSLPIDQLRWFYGPENQWRLCGPHHKIKTAREAAQRAAERRAEAAQAILPLGESTP